MIETIYINRQGKEVILRQKEDYANFEETILNAFGQPFFDCGEGWIAVGVSYEAMNLFYMIDENCTKEDAIRDLTENYNKGKKI